MMVGDRGCGVLRKPFEYETCSLTDNTFRTMPFLHMCLLFYGCSGSGRSLVFCVTCVPSSSNW